MSANDTLMDQCRREAEEVFPSQPGKLRDLGFDDSAVWNVCTEQAAKRGAYAAALYAERSKRPPTVQQAVDAAVEVFGLGPEDQDDVLRFGMKLQDMPHTGLTVEEVMEVVGPLCIGDATSLRIAQALTEKLNQTNG